MPALSGYMNHILFVDLTKGTVRREPLDQTIAKQFIGGAGYAARLLYNRLALESIEPFHPDNEVAIFTGPLTASGAPCTGRHAVCTLSALTGIWGESTSGGYFGAELRKAGLDGILISGKAKTPTFLKITDNEASLAPADHLWGRCTSETESTIRKDTGDNKIRVLSIGPAGENRVRFAAVMNDESRASARAGAGAVLGDKFLKAIAVRGSQKPELADPEGFREHAKSAFQLLEGLKLVLGQRGTLYSADMLMNIFNDMPVRYFSEPSMDITKINATALAQYRMGQYHCHTCPIGCGPIITIDDGTVNLKDVAGPEYETAAALGTLCQVDNLPLLCQANYLCNQYGLDTISCGNVIAFSFAAKETGCIPEKLIKSLDLSFGNPNAVLQLIEMITQRQGLGDLLAEGVRHAANVLGVPQLALHVKGLEVPMHDPRAFFGLATTYAVSPIGASHMQGDAPTIDMGVEIPEYGIEPGDRHSDEDQGPKIAKLRNWRTLFNSLTLCQLALLEPPLVTALYNAATSRELSPIQLLEIGERTMVLKRAFNIRRGISAADDRLPTRLFTPFAQGSNEGKVPNLAFQLEQFYETSQWDAKTGKPTPTRLTELGLTDVAEDLW